MPHLLRVRAGWRVVAPLEERLAEVARRCGRGGTRPKGAQDLQPPHAEETDGPRLVGVRARARIHDYGYGHGGG
eukprot:scaffold103754_cov51-Phaeocystis_antarctica.AAC.1